MAVTVRLLNASVEVGPPMRLHFIWSDGTRQTYAGTQAALRQELAYLHTSGDFAKTMALLYLLERSPALSQITSIQNRNFIVDFAANNPIRVV